MTAHLASSQMKRLRHLAKVYYEEETTTPEQYLLSTVESYMNNNQTHYVTDELLHVSYVGERNLKLDNIDPGVLVRPVANTVDVEEAYPGSKYVGIGVAGIFIIVLLAGLIYLYREDRQTGRDVEMDMEGQDEDDAEVKEDKVIVGEEDGAFPSTLNNMGSMAASDGSPAKLLLNESNVSNESSIPPSLDPNVPTDNLFGLQGKVCSDEYPEPIPNNDESDSSDIDVFEPISPKTSEASKQDDESVESPQIQPMPLTENEVPQDDDSVVSLPNEDDSDSQESSDDTPDAANDPNWAGIVNNRESAVEDTNLSPSEATAKMSNNSARFLVENGSSDVEDGSESDEDDPEKLGSNSLPGFV